MTLRKVLLIYILSIFCLACMIPSEATVKSEFLSKNPNAEIISTELIFEQDYIVVYLVEYKNKSTGEVLKDDFALRRKNLVWRWCDDQTERKCGRL